MLQDKTLKDYPTPLWESKKIQKYIQDFIEAHKENTEYMHYRSKPNNFLSNISKEYFYDGYYLQQEDRTGGCKGEGEYMDCTLSIRDISTNTPIGYFCITGRYSSWDNSEWDEGITVVEPYVVTGVEFRNV